MSTHTSKPVVVATVSVGGSFTRPGSPPSAGRVPYPNVYFPDEVEVELVEDDPGVVGVVNGPIWLDVWVWDPETQTERVLEQVMLSSTSEPVPSAIPPVKHKAGARAYSLRSGIVSGGDVVGRVCFRERA